MSIPFKLSLIGGGSEESRLKALAGDLGLHRCVEFIGDVSSEKLFTVLRNSDIYVSTARSDSSSVSLLEAMSQKLFPVVTDLPANREWLSVEQHFFAAGDPEQLANRIKDAADPRAREQAYENYEPILRSRGIREEQMRVAHLAYLKLLEDIERQKHHNR
jgi:glycosyltransferase involved in cell wall biosynthesis